MALPRSAPLIEIARGDVATMDDRAGADAMQACPGFDGVSVRVSPAADVHYSTGGLLVVLVGEARTLKTDESGATTSTPITARTLSALWQEWGADVADKLGGWYSFVVWDQRTHTAHCAVDPNGVSSLFVASTDHSFTASTETAPLRRLERLTLLDDGALPDVFNWRFLVGPQTLWSGIHQVVPGYCLAAPLGGTVRETSTRRFTYDRAPKKQPYASVADALHGALRRAFERQRDEGISHVAIPLSGGIDSSILGAVAKRTFPHCTAFTPIVEGFSNPELSRARVVAERLGIPLREVRVSTDDVRRMYPIIIERLEEPPRHFNNAVVARLLEDISNESSFVISGDGAGIFGSGTVKMLRDMRQKQRRMASVPRIVRSGISGILRRTGTFRAQLLADVLVHDLPWLSQSDGLILHTPQAARTLSQFIGNGRLSEEVVRRNWEADADIMHATQVWIQRVFGTCLVRRNSRLASAFGVQFWYPLHDRAVMDVARTVPPDSLYDSATGTSKPVLRLLCSELVGADVGAWPKIGFPSPEREWMAGPLRDELDWCLSPQSSLASLLDLRALRELPLDTNHQTLWTVMTLAGVLRDGAG